MFLNIRSYYLVLFIIILSFFSNLNVTAQTSEQIYKPPLSTVVTGSKYSEDSLQVPSFITTITKEQIQESDFRSEYPK